MCAERENLVTKQENISNENAFMRNRTVGGQRIEDLIAEQDREIVENQRPEEIPLDLAEELHLKVPDALAMAYRKFMQELGVE